VAGESSTAGEADTSNGPFLGLELHNWVLLVMATALGITVIWLVDHFGSRSRRSRQLFLQSAREGRR
jgi:hypothetical protein